MSRSGVPPQTTPFARLAAAHAVSAAGDAFLTAALAGSLFFTASVSEARGKTILYLCFTMAPFALIAPVIGPFLDRSRGGRKLMVFVTCVGRAFFCILMALHVDNFLLFPEAFSALVLQKAYSIAKSALVPSVVDDPDELVRANSRLALIAVVGSTVGILPAAAILKLTSARWVLRFGSVIYLLGALTALQIPRAKAVAPAETPDEKAELHSPTIILASSAMGVLRGAMGFLTFLLAFTLKAGGEPAWFFGLVLGASGLGGFLGAVTAPTLRKRIKEEAILVGALLVPSVLALLCARSAGRPAVLLVALVVAMGAASGSSPSTAWSGATRPMPLAAGPSPASRPASSSCGSWAPCSRWSVGSATGRASSSSRSAWASVASRTSAACARPPSGARPSGGRCPRGARRSHPQPSRRRRRHRRGRGSRAASRRSCAAACGGPCRATDRSDDGIVGWSGGRQPVISRRASQRPGASSSFGVGSRSMRAHTPCRASAPARSTTPWQNAAPRS